LPELDGVGDQIVHLLPAFHLEGHEREEVGDEEQNQTAERPG